MRIFFTVTFFLILNTGWSQQTHYVYDPEKSLKKLKEWVQQGEYGLAYPIARELKNDIDKVHPYAYLQKEIDIYYILCGLNLRQETALQDAEMLIHQHANDASANMIRFHLAKALFAKRDFEKALLHYEQLSPVSLSNADILQSKFERAFSLFSLGRVRESKPLFYEVQQIPAGKYYAPASYYYAYLSYLDKQYDEALKGFMMVESLPEYKGVAPYYITDIYNVQGKNEEALRYGSEALKKGLDPLYEKQLKLLIGHLYFAKGNYAEAYPLLNDYVQQTAKVPKEVLYEVSYASYKLKRNEQAIQGFRELSSEKDSMGQQAMYLLGDLYLQAGDKQNARNAFQYSAYNNSHKEQQRISKFNYAKLSYELGYQDIALRELQQYLQQYPNTNLDAEAKTLMIDLLAKSNNYAEALTVYESLNNPPADARNLYSTILLGRAVELFNDKDYNGSNNLLTKAIAQGSPTDVVALARFWRGEIAYKQGRYDESITLLNQYLQAGAPAKGEATQDNARYTLGYNHLQKQQYAQAASFFDAIRPSLAGGASNIQVDAFYRRADIYYAQRDFAKADAMYAQAIQAGGSQGDYALYQRAMIAGTRNPAEKIKLLDQLQKQYPSSSLIYEARMEIAQAYIADEKFADAIPVLQRLVAQGPINIRPAAMQKLGLAHYNLNNNSAALSVFKDLVKDFPNTTEAGDALPVIKDIYVELGQPAEYVNYMAGIGRAVNMAEADSLTYTAAIQKWKEDNCAASMQALEKYIKDYPTGKYNAQAHFYAGNCQYKSQEWDKAFAHYDAVIKAGYGTNYEESLMQAARIFYFGKKDYAKAITYFELANQAASTQKNKLEALRGLVRSYYNNKDFSKAETASKDLLKAKGISDDDKAIAALVLGKTQQIANDYNAAITSFKTTSALTKAAWGAESRYETAKSYFLLNKLSDAEKAAMSVIQETGSYDFWVTSAYILLGDIFLKQKDFFNAKATFESVYRNAVIPALKDEAKKKLDAAIEAEKQSSKIN